MGASKRLYINLLDFNFQVIFMHRKAEQKVPRSHMPPLLQPSILSTPHKAVFHLLQWVNLVDMWMSPQVCGLIWIHCWCYLSHDFDNV